MHWASHYDCDWIQTFWLINGFYGLRSETTNHNFVAHCRSQLYSCLIAKKYYIFLYPPHTTTTTLYKLHHHIFLHALYMKNLKTTMASKILQHISIKRIEFSCAGVIQICDKPSCECHHYAQLWLLIFSNPNIEKFVKPGGQKKTFPLYW